MVIEAHAEIHPGLSVSFLPIKPDHWLFVAFCVRCMTNHSEKNLVEAFTDDSGSWITSQAIKGDSSIDSI